MLVGIPAFALIGALFVAAWPLLRGRSGVRLIVGGLAVEAIATTVVMWGAWMLATSDGFELSAAGPSAYCNSV